MFFTKADKASLETLREAYRQHAVSLHPDQHEPAWEAEYTKKFQAMEAEYEDILAGISGKEYKQAKTSEEAEAAENTLRQLPTTNGKRVQRYRLKDMIPDANESLLDEHDRIWEDDNTEAIPF